MQIQNLIDQHYNSISSGSEPKPVAEEIRASYDNANRLGTGQVFEGSVVSRDGNQVVLSLSNGQNITARLEGNVDLADGQSVFFEVKSNSGGKIEITPLSNQPGNNPQILSALEQASLPETGDNLALVQKLMDEGMSVDRQSLRDMARLVHAFPDAGIDTIVSMKKMDIPVDREMLTQFDNFRSHENAILDSVGTLVSDIADAVSEGSMSGEEALSFVDAVLDTLGDNAGAAEQGSAAEPGITDGTAVTPEGAEEAAAPADGAVQENPVDGTEAAASSSPAKEAGTARETLETAGTILTDEIPAPADTEHAPAAAEIPNGPADDAVQENSPSPASVGGALREQTESFSDALRELPEFRAEHPEVFDGNGNLKPDIPSKDLLRTLTSFLSGHPEDLSDAKKLLASNPAKALLRSAIADSWSVTPEELGRGREAVKNLYRKMEQEIEGISTIARQYKGEDNPVSKTLDDVKSNVDFMNRLNETYAYVQIPLKMSGQNATGDLYVFRNRHKGAGEDDGTLTAFLHFDMENLGPTDISVRLHGKDLATDFFLSDDISFELVQKHAPELSARLEKKGYRTKIEVLPEQDEKAHLAEATKAFLAQDSADAAPVMRFTFDVRA